MAVTVEGYVVWSLQRGVGTLVMQGSDGNLVLYDGGSVLWSSETNADWNAGAYLVMQDDGNLVLYRADGSRIKSISDTAGAEPPQNWLGPGGWLNPGNEKVSPNERYRLRNQPDGNLVLYVDGWYALWSSGTGAPGYVTIEEGNVVIYRDDGSVWSSGTPGHPGAHLQVQDDGNVVVYADPSLGGGAVWDTQTAGGGPPTPTLTINGQGEGDAVDIRTQHSLDIVVSGIPGGPTDEVDVYTVPGSQLIEHFPLAGVPAEDLDRWE